MDSECIFFIDPVLSILPRNIIYESQKITNVSDICLIFNNFYMVKVLKYFVQVGGGYHLVGRDCHEVFFF